MYTGKFDRAIINAIEKGHLAIVKFLVSLPDVDPVTKDNFLIVKASREGHLPIVKFLASLEEVDPAARDNQAILEASTHGHLPVVEFLASLEEVDPAARNNYAIILASVSVREYLPIVKFLLAIGGYDSSAPISDIYSINDSKIRALLAAVDLIPNSSVSKEEIKTARREIEAEQRRLLIDDVLKICTTLRDLSALEQIEILDNLSTFAVKIPYYVKWDMITKCKHLIVIETLK